MLPITGKNSSSWRKETIPSPLRFTSTECSPTCPQNGRVGWFTRVSQTYNQMEFLGALTTYSESERTGLAEAYFAEDDSAPADRTG